MFVKMLLVNSLAYQLYKYWQTLQIKTYKEVKEEGNLPNTSFFLIFNKNEFKIYSENCII